MATVAIVTPLVANGLILGFNLGDELLCHSLSMQNLTVAADAVRASFPSAVIWWNECGHTASENDKWGDGVPASVSWVSIDFPYATTSPPGAKVPTWNSSGATAVMDLAPAQMVRSYLEQWLYPKMQAHQSVMLLTPAFGSRCYARAAANHTPLPPSICDSLSCHDDRAASLVKDYAAWAHEDPRVVAISPTFYHGCGYTNAAQIHDQAVVGHSDCFPAVCFPPASPWDWLDVGNNCTGNPLHLLRDLSDGLPVLAGFGEPGAMPKTLAAWQVVGRSVVRR